jgi:hypothetical protein
MSETEKTINTTVERKAQINIGNVDAEVKNQWEDVKNSKRLPNNELVAELLNFYISNSENVFNDQEKKIVTQAKDIAQMTTAQLINKATIAYCRKLIKDHREGRIGHKKTIAAEEKLQAIVQAIMDDNAVKPHCDKLYLNQTSIKNFAKARNHNFSQDCIKRYLEKNRDMLNEYHQQNNLLENHNQEMSVLRRINKRADQLQEREELQHDGL